MSNYLTFHDEDDYLKYCEDNQDRVILVYNNEVFDVTEFLSEHPGGADIIEEYHGNDVTELLHSSYPHSHSKSAIRKLKKYKIGHLKDEDDEEEEKKQGGHHDSIKVYSYPKVTEKCIEYKEMQIDLNRGIVGQIARLNKKQYLHILNNPIGHTKNHLFENPILETLVKNKWYLAPLLWMLIVLYVNFVAEKGSVLRVHDDSESNVSFGTGTFGLIFGLIVWILFEYMFQRCVCFGDDCLIDSQLTISLHFILYGKHRMDPSDSSKASFPFPLTFIIFGIMYTILTTALSAKLGGIVFIGFLVGYSCYERLHYQYHYGNPDFTYAKDLQKCHINLHHSKGKRCYGVTSNVWDKIFRSEAE